MKIPAKLRYLRIAPRKVRLVTNLIRGKSVTESKAILELTRKKAAHPLAKLLKSAVSAAKHNFQLDESNLYISEIFVDEGPKYKRWRPQARGATAEIQKKTSHITMILETTQEKPKVKKTKKGKPIEKREEKIEDKEIKKPSRPKQPKPEKELRKPRIGGGLRRFFRRKAF